MDPSIWDIIKAFPLRFIGQVILPITLGVLTAYAGYFGGWISLKDKFKSEQQAEIIEKRDLERAKAINQAFDQIGVQEEVLESQKQELNKQKDLTNELNLEYLKQKEFNELLNQIQITSLGTRNGSRDSFEKFYSLRVKIESDKELLSIWETEYKGLKSLWESELDKVNFYKLVPPRNNSKEIKWSIEYLYFKIQDLRENLGVLLTNKDITAYFQEIDNEKSIYFVETFYDIATEYYNINYSILAAKTLCNITNFEPYTTPGGVQYRYRYLIQDIPRFNRMQNWWNQSGSKNKLYTCPLKNIVNTNGSYYSYEIRNQKEKLKRIKFLTQVINEYPLLSRAKAELAYLMLDDKDTFHKVENLANQAISQTNMEPLPYLLIAYIANKKNDETNMIKYLTLASKSFSKQAMLSCIILNSPLQELNDAVDNFIP